jgi:nicotinate-nucleotide pyrophosphorylase (carboxylating)
MSYVKALKAENIIRRALREDIGKGDITTTAIIPKDKCAKAILKTLEDCVICGIDIAAKVFKIQDKKIRFKPFFLDGQKIKKGGIIACISGKARSILTAERVALNFLSLLSGISTKTRAYVDKVKPYKVKILDTRKTIPGLRELEKYAVRVGGGFNHRMRLDEMVLVKDNHLKVVGGCKGLEEIKGSYTFEIEVKNLKEFKQALKLEPDIIMLDNMSIKDMKKAVIMNRPTPPAARRHTLIEASGGIDLKNVKKIASIGVDMISIGELTDSIKSVDISLEFYREP